MKSVFWFVFLIFALVLLVITISEISLALVTDSVLMIPLVFAGPLFWIYRGLEIMVNKHELQVNYGFSRKRVSLSE